MFLAALLIGLREGLEAALIVGILLAFTTKRGRTDVTPKIWWGVGLATSLALTLGALFTYGTYGLPDTAEATIAGTMSLLAVALVTWMVFWMLKTGHRMKAHLESNAEGALALGAGWAMAWIAFIAVGREGLETALMLWGWALQPEALLGALVGILAAVAIGYGIYRGLVRIDFATFFTYTGAFLIIVAAGILAYGVHDLQEAGVLPGPFSGPQIAPVNPIGGYPFGWAFDLTGVIDPNGVWATLAKATIGFRPLMSWLEVTAWAAYLLVILPLFFSRVRGHRRSTRAPVPASPESESASRSENLVSQAGRG